MNTIILSFLCGAAFIGGAVATVCMVALAVQLKDKQSREEIKAFWRESLDRHSKQVEILGDIAATMEKLVPPKIVNVNPRHED